jgi:uncharacterized membrane protein
MKKLYEKKFLLVFILLHLVITLPLAYHLNIWADEASTLYTTEHGFFQAVQNTLQNEKQAPIYFWLISLWRGISSSIFFARIFSIIWSVIAIAVFYNLVRKIWNEKVANFATFFFAIHPFLIWTSLEIRVYSAIILLTLLLVKFFFEGYLENEENELQQQKFINGKQVSFVLTAIISLYTHYYLGFILVGFFVVLLVLQRWQTAKKYFLQMFIVGVAILPLLWIIKIQFEVRTDDYVQDDTLIEGIRILWHHFLTFVLPTEIYPPEDQTFMSFVRVWLVRILGLAVLGLLIFKRKIFEKNILIFGTISAVIFAFLFFIYALLGGIYLDVRHATVVFIPLYLLLISVLLEIFPQYVEAKSKNFYWLTAVGVLFCIFYIYGVFSVHPNFTKNGDWARVAEFIEEREKPNQPIIIFRNYEALNLPYYYKGKNKILPDENFFKWNFETGVGTNGVLVKQNQYVISVIPKDAEEIWLVNIDICKTSNACQPLEKFVKENYTIIETKDFYKEQVRLLRKK